MKTLSALNILSEYDRRGLTVWSTPQLRMVLVEGQPAFRKTIERLCAAQILVRVSRGVYLFVHTARDGRRVLGELIGMLRQGEYCFEALESAANSWGVIPQTPLGALTVMTTGGSGAFDTPYGRIEFTHTSASVTEIAANIVPREGFIPIATRDYAIHGLKRCGRTTELSEAETLNKR